MQEATAKQNWKQFVSVFVNRVKASRLSSSSVMIAFYFLLSLFPLLVTAVTLLPYFKIDPSTIAPYLESIFPGAVYEAILPVLNSLFTQTNGGALSLGIIATLWSASRVIKHIQTGVSRAYGVANDQFFLFARILAVGTLVLLFAVILFVSFLLSVGEDLLQWLAEGASWLEPCLYILKWPVPIFMLIATCVVLYLGSPNLRLRVRDVLPGAFFSTLFFAVSARVFSLYINHAVQPFSAYGTLSSVFILMLWMRLIGYIILIGAILNATLYEWKHGGVPIRENKAGAYVRNKYSSMLEARRKKRAQ